MGAPFRIQSANGALTIDVKQADYAEGTPILGFPPGGGARQRIQPNQTWQVIPDPLGSGHYLIVSGASNFCIGIGANVALNANVTDDATDRGAALTLQAQEPINNHYQLWDFVPPTSGPKNAVFIQNPQTGFVMELQSHSTAACPLDVNPRRISNETYQLWTAVDQNGAPVVLPAVSMAPFGRPLQGFWQYVLLPPNQGDHLVGITVTLDISEDVVVAANACSVQINCNAPYLGPDGVDTEDYDRDAQFMQFGLFMQNNQLVLFTQNYHRNGGVLASEFPSEGELSAPFLQLKNNTISAGTRIIMNLCTDQNDFVIGIAGMALNSTGLPIGTPIYWPALGQPSWHATVDGGKIHQKAMAPVGAFQVVFCSDPSVQNSAAQFTSGMGTITVTASPGIAAQNYTPNPAGTGTDENSNMTYDLVPAGTSRLIAQPFGLPAPSAPPSRAAECQTLLENFNELTPKTNETLLAYYEEKLRACQGPQYATAVQEIEALLKELANPPKVG
jgi:ricin-type beta-trefoil lectin protein